MALPLLLVRDCFHGTFDHHFWVPVAVSICSSQSGRSHRVATQGKGDGMKEECIAYVLKQTLQGLKYFHDQGQVRDSASHEICRESNQLLDESVVFSIPARLHRSSPSILAPAASIDSMCWLALAGQSRLIKFSISKRDVQFHLLFQTSPVSLEALKTIV